MRLCLATSTALLLAVLSSTPAMADVCGAVPGNLVSNCGFETGTFSNWSLTGSNSSPAFLGVDYGIDAVDAHSGLFGAFLGGLGSVLGLGQVLATTPGTSYTLTYWLAQSPTTPAPYVNSFQTVFGSTTLFSATQVPLLPFTQYSFTTVATSTATALLFGARDDTGFFSLDDVTVVVNPAPEPASYLLVAPVMGAFIWLRRRKSTLRA